MKVLLTGATGFLGGEIARQLVQAGHELTITVRKTSKLDGLKGLKYHSVVADLSDEAALEAALQGQDALIHTAGHVGNRLRDRAALYEVNVEGTRRILAAAKRAGVKRVVHTSSIVAVGASDSPQLLNEDSAWTVANTGYHYVDSKRAGEVLALAAAEPGFEVLSINPGMILGPGDVYFTSTRIVLEYLKGRSRFALPGGLSFCDVREVAAAHVSALTKGRSGERYVVAGLNYTLEQTMRGLEQLTGKYGVITLPRAVVIGTGFCAEWISKVVPNTFLEDLNRPFLRYSMGYAFFDSSKATRELGYRVGEMEPLLRDTINDFISRGVVKGVTIKGNPAAALAARPALAA